MEALPIAGILLLCVVFGASGYTTTPKPYREEPLKCFVCTTGGTDVDPTTANHCADPLDRNNDTTRTLIEKCDGPFPACFKMKSTLYDSQTDTEWTLISRGCVKDQNLVTWGCSEHLTGGSGESYECYCGGQECNGAGTPATGILALIFSLSICAIAYIRN